jgi:2-methylisocitrate lyase-like PEP mutase family enzyme
MSTVNKDKASGDTDTVVARFRSMLGRRELMIAPGAVDAYWAKVIEKRGFPCLFVTGSGVSNTFGVPDIGLTTFNEMHDRLRTIARSVRIPVIADGDTGFGNELNTYRTVREYADAGLAAVVIEDQDPAVKRAGYLGGKRVIPLDEMLRKVRAAKAAQQERDIVVIARTDAMSVTGLDDVVVRCQAFVDNGADMVNVDSPESVEQLARIAREVRPPLGHLTHQVAGTIVVAEDANLLHRLGYTVVGYPDVIMRVATRAARDALDALKAIPDVRRIEDRMITMKERWEIVDTSFYDDLLDRVAEPGTRSNRIVV